MTESHWPGLRHQGPRQDGTPQPPRNPAGRPPDPEAQARTGGRRHMNASTQPGLGGWATYRLVGVAARLAERQLNRQLACLKLTKGALDALEAVAELEPATASDVADLLCVSRQSLGRVLRRLQGLGFLAKEPARDGRSASIRLTEAGHSARSTAEDLVRALPETGTGTEFRRHLEQHVARLRNAGHTPLPRDGTLGRHPGSRSSTSPNITNTHLNGSGAPT